MDLMRDAAMIVAIVGRTAALTWELDTIAELGLIGKLVLLLPPVALPELHDRWMRLQDTAWATFFLRRSI